MISKYLLLFLIPIVYGRITIRIRAGRSETDASVEFRGQNIAIISDKERETFNIKDRKLKEACEKFFAGREPTDVFVKRPTPWEDVYHKFNWPQVQRVLKPVRSRVLGINTKPVIVSTREFENYSRGKAKYNAAIYHQIEETVSNSWSTGGELTVGQSISYSVNYAAGSVGGTTSLSFSGNWGNETSKSKAVTLGTTTSVEVELEPGKGATATLVATHGILEIEVDYEAYLIGNVFANYHKKYSNHNWWSYPIKYVLEAAGMPNNVTSTEKITIGFYTSAKVEVRDKEISRVIRVAPATFIGGTGTLPNMDKYGQM